MGQMRSNCCSDHKIVVFSLCMYRCQEKLDFCQEGSLQFSSLQRLTIIDCCWLKSSPSTALANLENRFTNDDEDDEEMYFSFKFIHSTYFE